MPLSNSTNVLSNAGLNLDVIEESLTKYQYLLLKKFLELEEEKLKFRKLRKFIESELQKLSTLAIPQDILDELNETTNIIDTDYHDLLAKVLEVVNTNNSPDIVLHKEKEDTDQTHLDDFFTS